MRRRWIVALAGIATLFAGLAIAAVLRYLIPTLSTPSFVDDGTEDQAEIDAYWEWVNSGYPYFGLSPWLATAALIAGVAALALAARRAQLRQLAQAGSASATAARDASSAASVSAGSAESIS